MAVAASAGSMQGARVLPEGCSRQREYRGWRDYVRLLPLGEDAEEQMSGLKAYLVLKMEWDRLNKEVDDASRQIAKRKREIDGFEAVVTDAQAALREISDQMTKMEEGALKETVRRDGPPTAQGKDYPPEFYEGDN